MRGHPRSIRAVPRRGFNLVETLVATVVLSGIVTTVGAISSQALVAGQLNRHSETAASLIDRQLSMIDFTGVDAFLAQGQSEGTSEEGGVTYRWTITTEYQSLDLLYKVTVTVQWMDRGRLRTLTMDTLLDGSASQGLSASGTDASSETSPTDSQTPSGR